MNQKSKIKIKTSNQNKIIHPKKVIKFNNYNFNQMTIKIKMAN